MTDYDEIKIRRLDLTVLLVFLGLMRTRKAADVAAELGLTNSSISHALRRLRDVFEDELFLRRPHGLEPTAFAEQIEPDVRRAVDAVQAALSGPGGFNPAMANSIIRIAAKDREIASFIPSAFARITSEAPGIRFSVRSIANAESLRGLSDGTLDLAMGFFQEAGQDYDRHVVRRETYLVVARHGHPLFEKALTPESYASASHVLVSSDGSLSGIVDQTLAEIGLTRRVCIAIPSFLSALAIVAKSDFIATLPKTVVQQHAELLRLDHRIPPIDIRPFDVSVLTHRRNRKNQLHQWCLKKICAE